MSEGHRQSRQRMTASALERPALEELTGQLALAELDLGKLQPTAGPLDDEKIAQVLGHRAASDEAQHATQRRWSGTDIVITCPSFSGWVLVM